MPQVVEDLRAIIAMKVAKAVENEIFTINIDETTDDKERHFLNVILKFGETTILLETIFLTSAVNAQNLGQTTNSMMQEFNLGNGYIVFLTDNTNYRIKAHKECLTPRYPKMYLIGCWAHIVDYVYRHILTPGMLILTWLPVLLVYLKVSFVKNYRRSKTKMDTTSENERRS